MAIDVNELLAPIPGSDPAGSDASFSDQFDRIREARRADDPGLAQGDWQTEVKVADWREAQSLAEDILLRTSKDLQAGVWLAEAAIARHGLEGARDAFDLLAGLLDTYWDGLYPRVEGDDLEERAGKLAWFATYGSRALLSVMLNDDPHAALNLAGWIDSREVDNLGRQNAEAYQAALDEGRVNGETFDTRMVSTSEQTIRDRIDQVQAARDAFTRFSTTADARLGRDAPSLAAIEDALKKIQQVYARVATAKGLGGVAVAENVPEFAAGTGGAASGGGGRAVALDLNGGSLASKDAALQAIGEIAGFFRRTEPHSPVAYLLERAVAWANMP
ncbi:MAG: type VI secretion system protein TssA, partial [Lysobacteraceae bacterium]